MADRNAVQRAFDRFGNESGFEKKSRSWYSRSDEVVSISNLQKSNYGPQYYVNQSFWLRGIEDLQYPKSHHAHIVARLEGLLPSLEERLSKLLDLESDYGEEERVDELVSVLNSHLLPLIRQADSISGLRAMANSGTFASAGIRGPAQLVLSEQER
mgnify:FL=1